MDRLRFRLVLIALIGACVCQQAMAEEPVPQAQRIIYSLSTFKDGAPDAVNAIAQTSDGFLWLGAPAGLFRYDGVRFEAFSSSFGNQLLSTYVFTLFAPPTGGLWVGYAFGGFSFIKNGRVTNFAEPAKDTGTVYSFAQDKHGVMWAGRAGVFGDLEVLHGSTSRLSGTLRAAFAR